MSKGKESKEGKMVAFGQYKQKCLLILSVKMIYISKDLSWPN